MRAPSLLDRVRSAISNPETIALARDAQKLVASYMGATPRLPGCGTLERLCVRIADGMTMEEAAAREYVYRWQLPLNQWVNHAEAKARSYPVTGAWPVPHCIGM